MIGGVVVGSQGEGGCRSSMPDRGGVRWCLLGTRWISERVVVDGGGCCSGDTSVGVGVCGCGVGPCVLVWVCAGGH